MEERENEPTVYFQRMYPIEQILEATVKPLNVALEREVKQMMAEKPMELRDTVDMMLSHEANERLKAEFFQTAIRYDKLRDFLARWDGGCLDFTPECPREVYDMQIEAMEQYLSILAVRHDYLRKRNF